MRIFDENFQLLWTVLIIEIQIWSYRFYFMFFNCREKFCLCKVRDGPVCCRREHYYLFEMHSFENQIINAIKKIRNAKVRPYAVKTCQTIEKASFQIHVSWRYKLSNRSYEGLVSYSLVQNSSRSIVMVFW